MSLKKNFVYQIMYQVLVVITPLITAPYISRVLGATSIGIASYTYSIAGYFLILACLGVNNYANRSISTIRTDKKLISKTFSSIFMLHLILSLLMSIAYIIYCFIYVKQYFNIFMVQGIYIYASIFDITWLYYGLEQFKKITLRNICLKLISVISMFIFVKNESNLTIYCLILSLTQFVSQLVLWFGIKKYVNIVKVKFSECIVHLKPMIILFLPMIAIYLYKYIDRTMLGSMSDIKEVGYYDNSAKIINICLGIILALSTVMLPRMSFLYEKKDTEKIEKYSRYAFIVSSFLATAMTLGLVAVSDTFIPFFFGEGYEQCIDITILLAISLMFSSWSSIIKSVYFLPNRRDIQFTITLLVGAIINIILNFVLIPIYAAKGSAIATLFTECIIVLLQSIMASKYVRVLQYLFDAIPFLISGIIMYICIKFISLPFQSPTVILSIKIMIGAVVYIILSILIYLIYNKKLLIEIKHSIKH